MSARRTFEKILEREAVPLDNWIVEATGSIPANIPRYRTSECETREMGFLIQ